METPGWELNLGWVKRERGVPRGMGGLRVSQDGERTTYRKLTQPVPGGGAIHTKLKTEEGW